MAMSKFYIILSTLSNLCLGSPQAQGSLQAVLTALRNTPDLSIFSSLFLSTGGSSGIPAPAFEERFNDNRDSRHWTILAPVNSAFANVSSNFITTLTAPPAYELLATLLRNHILQGNYSNDELTNSGKGLVAVGGFLVSFDKDGGIFTNDGLTKSAQGRRAQGKLELGGDGYVPASNGGAYKIDSVLDFFQTYFGVDERTARLPVERRRKGTMANVLKEDPQLSRLRETLGAVEPELLERLGLFHGDDGEDGKTVFLAPGNDAFEAMPKGADEKTAQPSNDGASSYFLSFGLGTYEEGSNIVKSGSGFNITIDGGMANNAKVQDRVCAENGCVWVVGRWLDAFYGAFDG